MDNVYTIDATSDVIRGGENLGTRDIIKDLTILEVKALIEENIQKFGRPRFLAGMILWINDSNDTFCFSIYKNSEAFNITSLADISNPKDDLLMKELVRNSLSVIKGTLENLITEMDVALEPDYITGKVDGNLVANIKTIQNLSEDIICQCIEELKRQGI